MTAMFTTGMPLLDTVLTIVFLILITYPVLGGFTWFIGVICYDFIFKHRQPDWIEIPEEIEPLITIMIPAHNEEIVIANTINYLMNEINYHNYEVLVMDDDSTDRTPEILSELMEIYPKLRVVRIEKNRGKAHAFDIGVSFSKGSLILSNDADTVPEPDALWKYVNYFIHPNATNVAAVTANMDVQNRSRIISKSQTVEFSSIVGIIKRTQQGVLGVIYAYSGANTMYRRDALIDVGLFRQDRATEDISIAWDHQSQGWMSMFAPQIMFFMEVPENLRMLYRQRKRWAKGGTEVWLTNFKKVLLRPFEDIGRTIMFLDQSLSIIWAFFFWISSFIFGFELIRFALAGNYERIYHMFTMAFIFVCFEMVAGVFQLLASLIADDSGHKLKYFMFAPFYMLFYWMINAVTIATTFLSAVKTIMGYGSGVWESPERHATSKSHNN